MEFVHRPYIPEETIAAIATPIGDGGVAIIRISGKSAIAVAKKVFSGPIDSYLSHTAHFGHILSPNGEKIDDVLLLPMRAPKSYTGEDTVEVHCHGGKFLTQKILQLVLDSGARAALPGEFSFRAFHNGKIDLAQAEAVQELVSAQNSFALESAKKQLEGALSKKIALFQKELTDIAAILEAWVDFPEEGLEFATMEEIIASLSTTQEKMVHLAQTFSDGQKIKDGASMALIGSPNVGKSSLMNALLGKKRAIVTNIAGTTRDLIEEEMRIGKMNFRLIDTAGIRETEEVVEKEGISRSFQTMQEADLVLFVLDAGNGISEIEKALLSNCPKGKTIAVWNKMDLDEKNTSDLSVQTEYVSAETEEGMMNLKKSIEHVLWNQNSSTKQEIVLTSIRHFEALSNSIAAVGELIEGLKTNVSPEFLNIDIRTALRELGTIIGTNIGEDILSAIFSKFCIGK